MTIMNTGRTVKTMRYMTKITENMENVLDRNKLKSGR